MQPALFDGAEPDVAVSSGSSQWRFRWAADPLGTSKSGPSTCRATPPPHIGAAFPTPSRTPSVDPQHMPKAYGCLALWVAWASCIDRNRRPPWTPMPRTRASYASDPGARVPRLRPRRAGLDGRRADQAPRRQLAVAARWSDTAHMRPPRRNLAQLREDVQNKDRDRRIVVFATAAGQQVVEQLLEEPSFDQGSAEIGRSAPNAADVGQIWTEFGKVLATLVDLGHFWADHDRAKLTTIDQF